MSPHPALGYGLLLACSVFRRQRVTRVRVGKVKKRLTSGPEEMSAVTLSNNSGVQLEAENPSPGEAEPRIPHITRVRSQNEPDGLS